MSQLSVIQQQNLITLKSTSTFSDNNCVSWMNGRRHLIDHILSNMNPVHNLNLHFFKIYHNLILSSSLCLVLSNALLLSGCLTTMLYALLISLMLHADVLSLSKILSLFVFVLLCPINVVQNIFSPYHW